MAFDFPSSPSLNQTYTFGTKKWIWNGTGWALLANAAAGSDKSVQFNDGGTSFGGDTSFTYDKTTTTLTVPTLSAGSVSGNGSGLTNIGNSSLTNSSVTIGSTSVSLGSTAATVSGLTLTTPTINGAALSGTLSGSPTFSGAPAFASFTITGQITRSNGGYVSSWMSLDGQGRQHWYWNTTGGASPTFALGGEDAGDVMTHVTNNGKGATFNFRSASGVGTTTGDPITWTTVLYADNTNFTYMGSEVVRDSDVQSLTNKSLYGVALGSGNGMRFWNNSTNYAVYMSQQSDATYGGRLDSTSDYNLYYKMTGGTNRGHVFTGTGGTVAQIDGTGHLYLSPTSASAPIILNANGQGQLVTGLNADQLDGQDGTYYQQALVSGTSIKTVNGTSLLGSGDVGTINVGHGGTGATTLSGLVKGNGTSAFTAAVAGTDYQAPLASGTNIKTVGGVSVLGSGDVSAPAFTGGTHTGITSLGVRSSGTGAFDLTIANTENLTAGRTLTLTLNNVARTINLGGNLTLANSFTTSGNFALTLTQTGATNVTLPTSGTLAVVSGALGTPTSVTLTNATGLPLSGISGLGTGVATALGTAVNTTGGFVTVDGAATLTNKTLTSPALSAPTFSTSATVTAGTNAQGQGALTSDLNVVTTASNNPSGVTLPTATAGRCVEIVNKGANPVNVYPASGGTIDSLSTNAAISLPVGGVMSFYASSTTQWYSSYNLTTSGGVAIGGSSGDVLYNSSGSMAGSNLKVNGNTIELRNSTTAQRFDVYNTYTNSSLYEGVKFEWNANTFFFQPIAAGTGRARNISILGSTDSNASGKGSDILVQSGSGYNSAGYSGAGGDLTLNSGFGSPQGSGGNVSISTGAGGSTSGNSGTLTLQTSGVTSGTVGSILLKTGLLTALEVKYTASAVNYPQITGSSTGNPVTITAAGSDTDVGVNVVTKGAGQFLVNGSPIGNSIARVAKTANYTLVSSDTGKMFDCSTSSSFTMTFTTSSSLPAGWWCYITNTSTNAGAYILLSPTLLSGDTFDGLSSLKMYSNETRLIVNDGAGHFYTRVVSPFFLEVASIATFTVPSGYSSVGVRAWGAGASGSTSSAVGTAAHGGAGGACMDAMFKVSDLGGAGTNITVTIGAGGSAPTPNTNSAGSDGGNTTFGSYLTAYGGKGSATGSIAAGGSGSLGTGTTAGVGGGPLGGAVGPNDSSFGGGGGANASTGGGSSYWGGGGGGFSAGTTGGTSGAGGGSVWGGGGGGGGGGSAVGGAGGTSLFGGNGGNGGQNTGSTPAQSGSVPGGGGGGGKIVSAGNGGNGLCRIWGIV